MVEGLTMADSSNQPVAVPVVTVVAPVPAQTARFGPSHWLAALRPQLPVLPTRDHQISRIRFDVLFAGAHSKGKWEDEWPLMTKDEFLFLLLEVGEIKLGG